MKTVYCPLALALGLGVGATTPTPRPADQHPIDPVQAFATLMDAAFPNAELIRESTKTRTRWR